MSLFQVCSALVHSGLWLSVRGLLALEFSTTAEHHDCPFWHGHVILADWANDRLPPPLLKFKLDRPKFDDHNFPFSKAVASNKMHPLKVRLFDRSQFSLCGRDGYGADWPMWGRRDSV
jgi:hypothetical protein